MVIFKEKQKIQNPPRRYRKSIHPPAIKNEPSNDFAAVDSPPRLDKNRGLPGKTHLALNFKLHQSIAVVHFDLAGLYFFHLKSKIKSRFRIIGTQVSNCLVLIAHLTNAAAYLSVCLLLCHLFWEWPHVGRISDVSLRHAVPPSRGSVSGGLRMQRNLPQSQLSEGAEQRS
jgi:hypothetical protein